MGGEEGANGASGRGGPSTALLVAVHSRGDLMRHLQALLADGALRTGDRLPNERQISAASGLSRSTVRAVLADLERQGRVSRHVGRGTYVTNDRPVAAERTSMADEPVSPGELMEFRATLEPALVDLIVVNATDSQLRELGEIAGRGRVVDGWEAAEAADRAFHHHLYQATSNRMLQQVGRSIVAIRAEPGWTKLKQRGFSLQKWAVYQQEHEDIAEALGHRDAELARVRLKDHLLGVRSSAKSLLGDL